MAGRQGIPRKVLHLDCGQEAEGDLQGMSPECVCMCVEAGEDRSFWEENQPVWGPGEAKVFSLAKESWKGQLQMRLKRT